MIALIGNINWMELLIVALIAVMVFGRDLPQVAAKAFVQLQKLRKGVVEVWRETGIGQEMRSLSRQLEEADREARSAAARARRIQSEIYRGREQPRRADRPEDAAADEARELDRPQTPPTAGAVPGTRAVEGGPSPAASRKHAEGAEDPRSAGSASGERERPDDDARRADA